MRSGCKFGPVSPPCWRAPNLRRSLPSASGMRRRSCCRAVRLVGPTLQRHLTSDAECCEVQLNGHSELRRSRWVQRLKQHLIDKQLIGASNDMQKPTYSAKAYSAASATSKLASTKIN